MKFKYRLLLGLLGFGIVASLYAAQSYRVNVGTCVMINEHSVCKDVQNNCSSDIFVPTNTGTEWSTNFVNNKPGCVTFGPNCGKNCL